MTRTNTPLEADKRYVVSGWASVNEGTQGPPVWEPIAAWIAARKTVRIEPSGAVRLIGA